MLGSFCSFVVVKSVCDVTRHTYLPPGCCFLPLCASRTISYTRPHLAASKLVVYVIICSRAAAGGCGPAAGGAVGHSPSSTLNTHASIPFCIIALQLRHHHHPFSQSLQFQASRVRLEKQQKFLTLRFDEFFFFLISPHTICAPPRTQLSSMYRRISFPPLAKARVVLGGCSLRPSRQASASEDAIIYTISV